MILKFCVELRETTPQALVQLQNQLQILILTNFQNHQLINVFSLYLGGLCRYGELIPVFSSQAPDFLQLISQQPPEQCYLEILFFTIELELNNMDASQKQNVVGLYLFINERFKQQNPSPLQLKFFLLGLEQLISNPYVGNQIYQVEPTDLLRFVIN